MAEDEFARIGRRMTIIAWLLFFGLMFLFFYYYTQDKSKVLNLGPSTILIKADRQGHYWLEGSINGEACKFIIDTGATLVAVPEDLAKKFGLTGQYPIMAQTAGGQIKGELTRIKHLKFAQFSLNNVKAVIIPS